MNSEYESKNRRKNALSGNALFTKGKISTSKGKQIPLVQEIQTQVEPM